MDELADTPRPVAVRNITDEQVEALVTRTLTEKGPGRDSHWSTRTMAAETGRTWPSAGRRAHQAQDPPTLGT
jgi:hypothetical protein